MDRNFLKSKNGIVGLSVVAAIVLVAGGALLFRARHADPGYQYASVGRSDIFAEVRLDGTVVPATQVDLAFESSGAVATVAVKAGDAVKTGQIIATLRASDQSAASAQALAGVQAAQAQVAVCEAALDAQNAALAQTENGATSEVAAAAESAVAAAQTGVDSADAALEAAKNGTESGAASDVAAAVTDAQSSVSDARNALLTVTDIQYDYFHGSDQDSIAFASAKESAISTLFGVSGAGSWNRVSVSELNGGTYAEILAWKTGADKATVEEGISRLADALRSVGVAIAGMPVTDAFSSADISALSGAVSLMNGDIETVSSDLAALRTRETTSASSIVSATAAVAAAEGGLTAAKNQLAVVSAGSRAEQVDAAKANVRRAEADLASAQARVAQARAGAYAAASQLGKTTLRSPIDGVVARMDAKVGQFAAASVPVVSLMSAGAEQIEAWAAQTDVSSLSVGSKASLTLDAVSGETFDATVVSVDLAPTVVSGVPSYKITLVLAKDDSRIHPGMAANVRVAIATRPNAIVVPESALIRHGGTTYVIVDDNGPVQREIDVGLVSEDGRVEIVRGLEEGDRIAQFGIAN